MKGNVVFEGICTQVKTVRNNVVKLFVQRAYDSVTGEKKMHRYGLSKYLKDKFRKEQILKLPTASFICSDQVLILRFHHQRYSNGRNSRAPKKMFRSIYLYLFFITSVFKSLSCRLSFLPL